MSQAAILLGRGGYGNGRRELERLAVAVRLTAHYHRVLIALVDQGEPSLPTALDACATAGAERVVVLPVFLPSDANLQTWLAKVARRWQAAHPASSVAVAFGSSLGAQPALAEAVLAALAAAEDAADVAVQPPANWERDPAGWSVLPTHHFHLLTCCGPRCTALGAAACWAQLNRSLTAHGIKADEGALIAQTGCLYPCNHGPVLVVYPAGVWYGDLTPERVERIVAEHLAGGRVVYALRITPGRETED